MNVDMNLNLLELPPGFHAYMVVVNPSDPDVMDIDRPHEPDLSMWLVFGAMADARVMSVQKVLKRMRWYEEGQAANQKWLKEHGREGVQLLTELHVWWALRHPASPFGVGLRGIGVRETDDYTMTVTYHGDEYDRDRRGVLTPTGNRDNWPTPAQWSEFFRLYKIGALP